ncbi:hypothetical protein CUC15_12465 [Oceanobacillus zhaokaii]|uniref:Uncharacterized protein n=1 Tax=Oceanobacillus zhaokaii TaxID=2052660 RepID=A0A345PI56_9BACI|nr:hypothetical protein [Oceanobacillus zhaokaii]AXI09686.1 hypothetical protein CUC15_12465 [Oceanobacillus zhaokaii]
MKNLKNEQGYALLVVVLMVVLVLGFSTFFMSASLSNAKQEQKVDQQNLAVVAAEMGVDYYTNAITNEYFNQIDDLFKFGESEIEKIKGQVDSEDYSHIRTKVRDKLKYNLENYIIINLLGRSISTFDNSDYFFLLDEITVEKKDKYRFFIKGIVNGDNKVDTNPQILTFNLTFFVPEFKPILDEDSGDGVAIPKFNELQFPKLNKPSQGCEMGINQLEKISDKKCFVVSSFDADKLVIDNSHLSIGMDMNIKNSPFELKNKSELYVGNNLKTDNGFTSNNSILSIVNTMTVKNNMTITNSEIGVQQNLDSENNVSLKANSKITVGGEMFVKNNLIVDESLLIIKNNLDAKNNFEISNDSSLLIGLNLDVKNNFIVNSNSTLYVGRNLDANNNPEISNKSSVFVGGNFYAKNNLKVNDHSTLFVRGNLNAENNFKVSDNSKVCIAGSLSYQNNFTVDDGSKIYILGDEHSNKEVIKLSSLEELEKTCQTHEKTPGGLDPNIIWNKPEIKVTYNLK